MGGIRHSQGGVTTRFVSQSRTAVSAITAKSRPDHRRAGLELCGNLGDDV
jgi:hypothetical protein